MCDKKSTGKKTVELISYQVKLTGTQHYNLKKKNDNPFFARPL